MLIDINQWNAAIEFMLTRQVEDKLYKSYAFLLTHTQLFLSLHGKELSEEQQEEQKVRLYKIIKSIFAFQKYLKSENSDFGPLLTKKITIGKPITEFIMIGEGENKKPFDNIIAVVLSKNEERLLTKIALELGALFFNK